MWNGSVCYLCFWVWNEMRHVSLSHWYAVVIPRSWCVVSHTVGSDETTCLTQVGMAQNVLNHLFVLLEHFILLFILQSSFHPTSIIPVHHSSGTVPPSSSQYIGNSYVALCCCCVVLVLLVFLFTLCSLRRELLAMMMMMMMMMEFYWGVIQLRCQMLDLIDSLLFQYSSSHDL